MTGLVAEEAQDRLLKKDVRVNRPCSANTVSSRPSAVVRNQWVSTFSFPCLTAVDDDGCGSLRRDFLIRACLASITKGWACFCQASIGFLIHLDPDWR